MVLLPSHLWINCYSSGGLFLFYFGSFVFPRICISSYSLLLERVTALCVANWPEESVIVWLKVLACFLFTIPPFPHPILVYVVMQFILHNGRHLRRNILNYFIVLFSLQYYLSLSIFFNNSTLRSRKHQKLCNDITFTFFVKSLSLSLVLLGNSCSLSGTGLH